MSCWRTANCELKNINEDILEEAAKTMGLGINRSIKRVHTSYGNYETNDARVDGVFTKHGRELPIGYVLKDGEGKLAMRGDFWQTGIDPDTFMGELGQRYTEANIRDTALAQGYTIESVVVNAEGDTEIVCYAWA